MFPRLFISISNFLKLLNKLYKMNQANKKHHLIYSYLDLDKTGWGRELWLGYTWEGVAWDHAQWESCYLRKQPWKVATWEQIIWESI